MFGFAKLAGKPDWPVQVLSEAGSRLKVEFFGTNKSGLVSKTNFIPFTKEHLVKISTKQSLSRGAFKAGISEIRKAVEASVKDKSKGDKKQDIAKKNSDPKKGLRKQRDENNLLFKTTIVKSGTRRLWSCVRCRFRTAYRFKARNHAVICNTITNRNKKRLKNISCVLCPELKPFPSRKDINKHNLKVHGLQNLYICVKGHPKPLKFLRRRDYFRHQREKHPLDGSRSIIYHCGFCKRSTYQTYRKYNYKRHIASKHPEVKMIRSIIEEIASQIEDNAEERKGEQSIKQTFIPEIISKLVDSIIDVSNASKQSVVVPEGESDFSLYQKANLDELRRKFREVFKEELEEKEKVKDGLKIKKIVTNLKRKLNSKEKVSCKRVRRSKRLNDLEDSTASLDININHNDVDSEIQSSSEVLHENGVLSEIQTNPMSKSQIQTGRAVESQKNTDSDTDKISDENNKETDNNVVEGGDLSSSARFNCGICCYRTNKASNFHSHMSRLHSDKGVSKECTRPWCKEKFATEFERKTHTKMCFLMCDICQKKFDRQDHFNSHMKAENNKAAKIVKQMIYDSS